MFSLIAVHGNRMYMSNLSSIAFQTWNSKSETLLWERPSPIEEWKVCGKGRHARKCRIVGSFVMANKAWVLLVTGYKSALRSLRSSKTVLLNTSKWYIVTIFVTGISKMLTCWKNFAVLITSYFAWTSLPWSCTEIRFAPAMPLSEVALKRQNQSWQLLRFDKSHCACLNIFLQQST